MELNDIPGNTLVYTAAEVDALDDNVITKTTTYTALLTDDIILADATTGSFVITLPPAAGHKHKFNIKKIDSSVNTITVDGDGAETIDGSLTQVLSSQYDNITVISDGSNWHIL